MLERLKNLLVVIGPGVLVAATGVGAGDLGTAGFAGVKLGTAVLWAVLLGALLKYVLNEGLTRWQLATGTTLLEGSIKHFGKIFSWLFLAYFLIWSFLVGLALLSACGATWHAILPIFNEAQSDKIFYGAVHSLLAVVLVIAGGYKLFEKVMGLCIAVMFLVVVATAVALRPTIREVITGAFIPRIPHWNQGGLDWTIALLGGVGGTLTILCYGYWIREEGRTGPESLTTCRIDLATGYLMTALFGMGVIVIGSRVAELQSTGGVTLLLEMSDQLKQTFGAYGVFAKWAFLVGAWGAVFSSLLGVWQSLPYLFADFCDQSFGEKTGLVSTTSFTYRSFLYALALVPVMGLVFIPFQEAMKIYAIIGALVVPFLAGILLWLNNRTELVGKDLRNTWRSNVILSLTLVFSVVTALMAVGI